MFFADLLLLLIIGGLINVLLVLLLLELNAELIRLVDFCCDSS